MAKIRSSASSGGGGTQKEFSNFAMALWKRSATAASCLVVTTASGISARVNSGNDTLTGTDMKADLNTTSSQVYITSISAGTYFYYAKYNGVIQAEGIKVITTSTPQNICVVSNIGSADTAMVFACRIDDPSVWNSDIKMYVD